LVKSFDEARVITEGMEVTAEDEEMEEMGDSGEELDDIEDTEETVDDEEALVEDVVE
jgi:hypothetical protein